MDLRFSHHRSEDWTFFRVGGEIDIITAPRLATELCRLAEHSDTVDLLVDLTDVAFIDASGLNALVQTHKVLAARDRRLHLTGLKPHLLRVLQITGLDHAFEILDPSAVVPRQPTSERKL